MGRTRRLLTIAFLFSGCDYNPALVNTAVPENDLPYLQTFKKLKVSFSAGMLQHSFVKQGVIDPGVTHDIWLPRELLFENQDSLYTIAWNDSVFQTKACLTYAQIDPYFGISYGCGDRSFVLGV